MNETLTAVSGLAVGHWSDPLARTGCTVVLCPPEGCVASGLALGSAPGSREIALLEPAKTVSSVHAVLLTGGSAFGLAAASGVMRWLEEHDRGLVTPAGRVPIVPAAVIFDLAVGRSDVRPDERAGYQVAAGASQAPVTEGSVGVGTGATVGKLMGLEHAEASGVGGAATTFAGATIAVLAVSNALGNIVDPESGVVLAGVKKPLDPLELPGLLAGMTAGSNTTLVVVATDAAITKAEARMLAHGAHVGIARVTRPSHTALDGDTAFVLTTARGPKVAVAALGVAIQELVARAIVRSVTRDHRGSAAD